MSETDFKGLIGPVALALFGEPTFSKTAKEWRYGTKGSLSINLEKDVWKNFETDEGGGVVGLVIHGKAAVTNAEAYGWMEQQGIAKGNGKANGTNGSAFPPRTEILVDQYEYTDEFGAPTIATWRYVPRRFERYRWDGERWQRGGTSGLLTHPYKLMNILWSQDKGMTIYICEGEKDVDRLTKLRLIATTNIGGAGSWKPEINKWFEGRDVVILPDNDDAGRKHARNVAKQLSGVASSLRVVELPSLPEKGDVSDWLDQNGDDREKLINLCMTATKPSSSIRVISAFPINPRTIPQRPWIIPGLLIRGHVTVLVAPPGAGKSLLTLQLSLMLSTAIQWGGWMPRQRCRVLVINTEDDVDEMKRRLATAATVMGIEQETIGDRIILAEEPETIVIARTDSKTKTVMRTPLVDEIIQLIMDMGIDAIVVDPFAETFEGDENSNSELKWAAILWREIARRTKCAVFLVHHTRKYSAGMSGDMDAARGASALIGVARIVATLFTMTPEEAKVFDINDSDRFRYVRFDDAKVQFGVVTGNARWFEKATYEVGNPGPMLPGDDVGILKPWAPPGLLEGVDIGLINRCLNIIDQGLLDDDGRPTGALYTKNKTTSRSTRWAGQVVIDTLGCDEDRAKEVIKRWVQVKDGDARGLLYEVDWNDGKQDRKGLKVDPTKRPGVMT